MNPGRLALCSLALAAGSATALAQTAVISARSGLIHYIEGQVYAGDQEVDTKFGTFPEVKENQILRTGEGRAEVLLTPGVFLRLGENSSFRMITNRLIDTRLEFLTGSAIIEADNIGKDNSITLVYKDATVHPTKKGLYRLDASPAELRVYDGLVDVALNDKTVEAKEGHAVDLESLAMRRFDRNTTDALNRWSERRGEYVSMASVSAANSLRNSMYSGGFGGFNSFSGFNSFGGGTFGGWFFNPYMGMYTFVPGMDGEWFSSYGYPFWSPFNVYMAYMPGYYFSPYGSYGGYYGSPYAGVYNTGGGRGVPVAAHYGAGAASLRGAYAAAGSSRGGAAGVRSAPSAPSVGIGTSIHSGAPTGGSVAAPSHH